MEWKKKESGEGGEEFALMKNGAWSKDGSRQTQKCHQNLRMQWMYLMKCHMMKKDSFAVPTGIAATRETAARVSHLGAVRGGLGSPCSQCRSWAWATADPAVNSRGLHTHSWCFWQDGRVLGTALPSSHNALENVSMASRGTICTSTIFPQRQAWII